MQDEIEIAFWQAGQVTSRNPAQGCTARPVRPDHSSRRDGCGRGLVAVGEEIDGSESGVAAQQPSEELIESREEEVQPARVLPTPYTPTQDEVDEHSIDHIPYRCWCEHCLNGFGRDDAHRAEQQHKSVPGIRLDYMFVTKTGSLSAANVKRSEIKTA